MQKIVDELQKLIPFKDTTDVGDIVLIAAKDPQVIVYAQVHNIERDDSRREEWYHVHFTILSIPLQEMQWTLRTEQLTGQEIFTMGGEERFVKAVVLVDNAVRNITEPGETKTKKKKTVTLKRLK